MTLAEDEMRIAADIEGTLEGLAARLADFLTTHPRRFNWLLDKLAEGTQLMDPIIEAAIDAELKRLDSR